MPMLQGKLIQAAQSSALALSTAPWTADLAQAAQGVVDRGKTEKEKKKKKVCFAILCMNWKRQEILNREGQRRKAALRLLLFCFAVIGFSFYKAVKAKSIKRNKMQLFIL